jgi:DNA-binding NarL/FixJ family response regulator
MLTSTLRPAVFHSDHERVIDSTAQTIRLMVVDDHPAVRAGLGQLLEAQRGFSVDAVCVDAEGAIAQAAVQQIDVAIVDYQLGGRNGLSVCRAMKRLPEPPRVIIFSAFANDHLAACCVVAEADAVLNKGALGSELCDAVRSVARGRRLLPRTSRSLANMLRRRLSVREQMVFGMLLAGIARAEIERTLEITGPELDAHRDAMLTKLESVSGELPMDSRRTPRLDLERLIRQPSAPMPVAG